jgi:hypothetical protein
MRKKVEAVKYVKYERERNIEFLGFCAYHYCNRGKTQGTVLWKKEIKMFGRERKDKGERNKKEYTQGEG